MTEIEKLSAQLAELLRQKMQHSENWNEISMINRVLRKEVTSLRGLLSDLLTIGTFPPEQQATVDRAVSSLKGEACD